MQLVTFSSFNTPNISSSQPSRKISEQQPSILFSGDSEQKGVVENELAKRLDELEEEIDKKEKELSQRENKLKKTVRIKRIVIGGFFTVILSLLGVNAVATFGKFDSPEVRDFEAITEQFEGSLTDESVNTESENLELGTDAMAQYFDEVIEHAQVSGTHLSEQQVAQFKNVFDSYESELRVLAEKYNNKQELPDTETLFAEITAIIEVDLTEQEAEAVKQYMDDYLRGIEDSKEKVSDIRRIVGTLTSGLLGGFLGGLFLSTEKGRNLMKSIELSS